jgi:hypothetical protein
MSPLSPYLSTLSPPPLSPLSPLSLLSQSFHAPSSARGQIIFDRNFMTRNMILDSPSKILKEYFKDFANLKWQLRPLP